MGLESKAILARIEAVLAMATHEKARSTDEDLSDVGVSVQTRICALLGNALIQLSPPATYYARQTIVLQENFFNQPGHLIPQFYGMLEAVRCEYMGGGMASFTELVHGELFSDFVEMARHLLAEGYKDAAAVIIGSTLESHLRQLCVKHGVPVTDPNGAPLKAERLNADLAKGAYGKQEQKQVTAWLDLRNEAAHGHYDKYVKEQVVLMIDGVAQFMLRWPA